MGMRGLWGATRWIDWRGGNCFFNFFIFVLVWWMFSLQNYSGLGLGWVGFLLGIFDKGGGILEHDF